MKPLMSAKRILQQGEVEGDEWEVREERMEWEGRGGGEGMGRGGRGDGGGRREGGEGMNRETEGKRYIGDEVREGVGRGAEEWRREKKK